MIEVTALTAHVLQATRLLLGCQGQLFRLQSCLSRPDQGEKLYKSCPYVFTERFLVGYYLMRSICWLGRGG